MKPSDLTLLVSLGTPTAHPDGGIAVVAVSHPDLDADATVSQLWRIPLSGEQAPERLTRGARDSAPRFSPDGRLLAFLRGEPGSPSQLHLVPAAGGDAVAVTDAALGVDEFAWSPDGARLAFVARVAEQGRYGTVDGIGPGAERPRRITTLNYLSNGTGYVLDRPAQLFVVDVPDVSAAPAPAPVARPDGTVPESAGVPEARQLTHGDADCSSPVFRRDGRAVVFASARHPERDVDLLADAWEVAVDGSGEPLNLTAGHHLAVEQVAVGSDDAVWVTAGDLGESGRDFVGRQTALHVVADDGPRSVLGPDAVDLTGSAIVPAGDGSVLVVTLERGTAQVVRARADGTSDRLSHGPLEVGGVATSGDAVVITFADGRTSGDVGVIRGDDLDHRTDFSAPLREHGLAPTRELTVDAPDGYPVHGWVVEPEGEGPHPVLLLIHGGPFAQYGVHLFDEAQVAAAAGYGVVMCNPRGSAGYGEAHGRAIRQRMGTDDLADVLAFLDGAIGSTPSFDGARVGVMGGSYGGYLTAWTIAHDHRFAGAIVERGFLDPVLFDGTSDIGAFFGEEYVGTDPDAVAAQSPQAVAGQVTTPTLVIHSEDDLRCPLSQGQRYFSTLKKNGIETELVIFPGEDHELSRAGRPRHRVERFEIVLDWWARHLPSATNTAPTAS